MDLKSGYPYWTVKNGLLGDFPALDRDVRCDVAVVGAGISGTLIAKALCEAGQDVVVLDRRDAGWGSTSATTALLQYEIDGGMLDIAQRYGESRAADIFKACAQAVTDLEPIARSVRGSEYRKTSSFYYASWPWHAARVREEGEMRRRHGFKVETLERSDIEARFGIAASAALLTPLSASMDPYRVTLGLLKHLQRDGCAVYDRTEVVRWQKAGRGLAVLTSRGAQVQCRHLVLATGYESLTSLRRKVARIHSSYALITEPIADRPKWLSHMLAWESRRPYLYLRDEGNGRVIAGGEDDRVDLPAKRDRAVPHKAKRILAKLGKLLRRDDLEIGYAWAGSFAETDDALPFFGPSNEHGPRVHFAMAYGGNGIVYSVLGAELIRRRILRQSHPLMRFLSFARVE